MLSQDSINLVVEGSLSNIFHRYDIERLSVQFNNILSVPLFQVFGACENVS